MKITYLATVVISLSAGMVFGQANVFTYQGQLRSAGTPITNGVVPMTFQLMGSPAGADSLGGPISTNVGVTNGLFTLKLDFSQVASAFNGQQRCLQLTVNGTPLSPRQELTPTPYSSYTYTAALAQSVASGSITAGSLQANLLTNGTLFGVWSLVGNNGINASNQFLGTTDPRPLNLRANNKPVMRFTEGTNTGNTLRAVNVLGGSEANSFGPGVIGGTIAGGGLACFLAATRPTKSMATLGPSAVAPATSLMPFVTRPLVAAPEIFYRAILARSRVVPATMSNRTTA